MVVPVRPSALQIAEYCTMAPALALQYPETSKWAVRGTDLHLEIGTGIAVSPEAKLALAWLADRRVLAKERPVKLRDPESGEEITEGTVDLAIEETDDAGKILVVVDWKSGQAAYVTDPDKNLQFQAYGLALAIELGYDRYQPMVCFLRDTGVEEYRGRIVEGKMQWVMLNRIKAIQGRAAEANPGPHCSDCWQSVVCGSFRERVKLALTLLPEASPDAVKLTDEQALALVQRIENVEEALKVAEELAKAHVRNGGRVVRDGKAWRPTVVPGRRSVDLEALEADGHTKYVKRGQPHERWTWTKERAR